MRADRVGLGKSESVLVVGDITTSGVNLQEAARMLRGAGVSDVSDVVVSERTLLGPLSDPVLVPIRNAMASALRIADLGDSITDPGGPGASYFIRAGSQVMREIDLADLHEGAPAGQ